MYGALADENAVELATHFGEAEAVADTDKLVHYSRIAGDQALASIAMEDALTHFDRALDARGGHPIDAEIAALHFSRGKANLALRNAEETVQDLTTAFDYYEKAGLSREAAAVAQTVPGVVTPEVSGQMQHVQERALKLVEPGSLDEGRLLEPFGV